MGMMIIRHRVRDYGQWRPIFDRHTEMQKAAGLTNPRVYHSADSNKSEIVVVFDTKNTKMAKEFAASVDLKDAMRRLESWTCQRSIFLKRLIEGLANRTHPHWRWIYFVAVHHYILRNCASQHICNGTCNIPASSGAR